MTTEEKIQFVIQNWDKMSLKKLAEKLEVCRGTIYLWTKRCQQHGITLPAKALVGRGRKLIDWEKIKQSLV